MNEVKPRKLRTSFTYKQRYTTKFGSVSESSSDIFHDVTWDDSRTGVGCNGYRWKIRNQLNATTAFTGSKGQVPVHRSTTPYLSFVNNGTKNEFWYIGDWVRPSSSTLRYPDTSLDDTARARAAASFIRKARSHQNEFQGMVFLGELGETVSMIGGTLVGMLDLTHGHISGLQKIRKSLSRKGLAKAAADRWLEFAFGWKPLYMDMQSALEAYNNLQLKRRSSYIHAVASEFKTHAQTYGQVSRNYWKTNVSTNDVQETKVVYRGVVKHDIYSGAGPYARWLQHYGFDMQSFVPSLWELMPWSFLIDYFVNVNHIIEAKTFARSSLCWCSETVRRQRSYLYHQVIDEAATEAYLSSLGVKDIQTSPGYGTWSETATQVARTAKIPDVSTLVWKLPGFPSQWVNIAALAVSHKKLYPFY